MRTILGISICILTLVWSTMSFAYTVEVTYHIPKRYLLLTVHGADPDKPIDKAYIAKVANTTIDPNVEQLQIAIYDKGTTKGMRALCEKKIMINKKEKTLPEKEAQRTITFTERDKKTALSEERYLGYKATFSDIERGSFFEKEEDLEKFSHHLIFEAIPRSIAYDASGEPFISEEEKDKFSFVSTVQLSKKDPFLQKIQLETFLCIRFEGRAPSSETSYHVIKGKIVDMRSFDS